MRLRQELGELGRLDPGGARAWQCNIMALSVALATIVALAVRVDSTWWAAISAFVSTQATAPASLRRGMLRIVGTAAGAVLGLVLSRWLVEDTVALSLVLLVVGTTGVLGLLVSEHGLCLAARCGDGGHGVAGGAGRSAVGAGCGVQPHGGSHDRNAGGAADGGAAGAGGCGRGGGAAPGWSDLLGREWPAVQHALRAGIGVMLVPQVWSWLELPSLSQTAVTVAAVMAVPGLTNDPVKDEARIVGRGLHRLLGCFAWGAGGAGVPGAVGDELCAVAGDADGGDLGGGVCADQRAGRWVCGDAGGGGFHFHAGAGGRAAFEYHAGDLIVLWGLRVGWLY
ncbi:MAG: FUSC family protein [Rhodospirillales bacterium]